jgi:hypothetical protein
MRTIDIKDLSTDKIVARYHYWSAAQAREKAIATLPAGRYALQGTNSGSVSRKAWESAEEFVVSPKKINRRIAMEIKITKTVEGRAEVLPISTLNSPGRAGVYRLTLDIGLQGEQTDDIDIDDLVDDWRLLTDEEFEAALYAAWKEWAWGFVDGGTEKL